MGDYCIGLGTPLGFSPIPASDRMIILFWPEKHNNTIPKCPQNGLAIAITRYSPFLSISPMTQIVPNPFTACIRVVHVSNKHQYPFWIYTMAFLKWVKKRSCGRKCALLLLYYSIFYCCLMFFIYGDSASYLLIWDDDLTIVLGWIQDSKHQLDIPIDYGWEVGLSLDVLLQGSRMHLYMLRPDRAKCQGLGGRGDRTSNPLVNN